jgi:hypothetical protein
MPVPISNPPTQIIVDTQAFESKIEELERVNIFLYFLEHQDGVI